MQWFIPNDQHLLTEMCESAVMLGFPPPYTPMIAYMNMKQVWTFNISEIQSEISKETKEFAIACIMTDIFQELPRIANRKYTLLESQ